jgi:alkylhydroperoxidase family enzyme
MKAGMQIMTAEPRIPPLAAELLEERLGSLNVARTIGQNPALLKAWGVFATYILGPELSLSPRERELAILRVGWNHQAGYEWGHHVAIARGIGMTEQDILAVQEGSRSPHLTELECLIVQAADDIKSCAEISGQTWDGLKAHYSDQQMLDLIFTIGQYTLVCIALNSIKVQLEEGFSGLPSG